VSSQVVCGQTLHTFTFLNKVFVLLFVGADPVNSTETTSSSLQESTCILTGSSGVRCWHNKLVADIAGCTALKRLSVYVQI
jgi:hypothetical protein